MVLSFREGGLEASHLSITRVLVAGIEVRGNGSTLDLEDSSLSKFLTLENELPGSWSDGVVVRTPLLLEDKHAASLTRVRTSKVGEAFCAEDQGSMELNACHSDGDMMGCFSGNYVTA